MTLASSVLIKRFDALWRRQLMLYDEEKFVYPIAIKWGVATRIELYVCKYIDKNLS